MAILETIKAATTTVLSAAKANPAVAIGIGVGTAAVVGGGIYLGKRKSKGKKVDGLTTMQQKAEKAAADVAASVASPDEAAA